MVNDCISIELAALSTYIIFKGLTVTACLAKTLNSSIIGHGFIAVGFPSANFLYSYADHVIQVDTS